jgi:protein SCO1/2
VKQDKIAAAFACSFAKNQTMKNKLWWYVGFFVLLLAGYMIVVFSQTDINQSTLPVINNNVDTFAFTDQNGKKLTEKEVEGKVYVTEYFFTTCRGICPKMNTNMRRVYDDFKNEQDFMIISHTCMPEVDSVPLLKAYERKMLTGTLKKNSDGTYKLENDSVQQVALPANNNWFFVTGDKAKLYGMARHSYIIDNNKTDTLTKMSDQFIHTQLFALVDKQTRVRGIYDGLKEEEVQKLMRDIKGLLKEKVQTRELIK